MSMSRPISCSVKSARRSKVLALAGVCALALAGCAGAPKNKALIQTQQRPVELIYSTGASRLDDRQWVKPWTTSTKSSASTPIRSGRAGRS